MHSAAGPTQTTKRKPPVTHLIADTETTGKWNYRADYTAPVQPRLVQLGALMADDEGRIYAELNLLVKPDGWSIPAEATECHGITTEMCETYGVPIAVAMASFANLQKLSHKFVAFNEVFDRGMLNSEWFRLGRPNRLEESFCHCVMKDAMWDCNLPGGRNGEPKWPTLEEAHRHYFNEYKVRAHDAMEDVKSCARIYFLKLWRQRQGIVVPPPVVQEQKSLL